MKISKYELQELISKGFTSLALEKLNQAALASEHKNEIIALIARSSENEKRTRQGIINLGESDIAKNQINASLLFLIDKILKNMQRLLVMLDCVFM